MAVFYNQAILSYNNTVTSSNIVSGEIIEVISASKTAVPGEYRANDVVTYIISITNSGTTDVNNLTITDNLGEYTFETLTLVPLTYVEDSVRYFSDGVLQAAPAVTAGPPLVISGINVPADGNATVIYQAAVNQYAPLATGSEIVNEAVVSGTGVSDVTVTETITAANDAFLTISKSLFPDSVAENGQLTYTFVIQNYGNTEAGTADNVAVTDTFNPILNPISVEFDNIIKTISDDYTYDSTTGEFATVAGRITVPAATYTQDPDTGAWAINPGVSVLTVTGTVQ